MTSPFDYLNTINTTKKNMMRNSENDALSEKAYKAYVVNNGLSYFSDTILHANAINMYHQLDNRPQYEFLLNSIRPRKRFEKWVKNAGDRDLDIVCEHYKCNRNIGREYLSLLSSDQIKIMEKQQETGGIKNESSRQPSRS